MQLLRSYFAQRAQENVDQEGFENVFLQVDLYVLIEWMGGIPRISWINIALGINLISMSAATNCL